MTINKDVTILGVNAGVAGNGARAPELVINGGLYITADGVTIDGVKITWAVQAGGVDLPSGVVVQADGSPSRTRCSTAAVLPAARPFSVVAGTEDLTVTQNLVSGWPVGAYIVIGATGSIDHNAFVDNGNGVVTESVDLVISDNSFEDSVGAHIALTPFAATATVADFVFNNNFLDLDVKPNPITIFPNGGAGQEIFGSNVAESFRGDFFSGPFTFHGGGGNDIAIGSTGDDTFFGDAGDDAYIYRPGSGADTFNSFVAGLNTDDHVDISAFPGITSFAQVLSLATQVGEDTVIDFGGGDVLTLANVLKDSLAEEDFGFNDAPVAQAGSASGNEDTVISGSAVATDFDNTAAQLTYSLVGVNGGATHGTVSLNPDGSFTYVPAANFNGGDSFSFKANDGALDSNTASIAIIVAPVNDPPVLGGDDAITVPEGGTVAVTDRRPTASDVDSSDAQLVYTVTGTSHGTVLNSGVASSTFTQADLVANLISFQHDGGELPGSFTVSLTDGAAPAQSATVNAIISPSLNDAPNDITGGPLAVDENSALGALAGVLTGQDPDNASFTYTLTDNAGGRFAINNSGQVSVANGVLLDFEQNASHSIGVRVTDPGGLSFDKAFTVAVNDLNPETAIGDAGTISLSAASPTTPSTGKAGTMSCAAAAATITSRAAAATTRRSARPATTR